MQAGTIGPTQLSHLADLLQKIHRMDLAVKVRKFQSTPEDNMSKFWFGALWMIIILLESILPKKELLKKSVVSNNCWKYSLAFVLFYKQEKETYFISFVPMCIVLTKRMSALKSFNGTNPLTRGGSALTSKIVWL